MLPTENLLFRLHEVASLYQLKLLFFINRNQQESKESTGIQFNIKIKHIRWYCNMSHDIVLFIELVTTLKVNSGVDNLLPNE